MGGRRFVRGMAAATVPLALAVQSVLALGDVPPPEATPETPERRASIDPGFVVRAGGDVDPGFIVRWEDTSNDAGFFADLAPTVPPSRTPTPDPATPEPPAITLGAP